MAAFLIFLSFLFAAPATVTADGDEKEVEGKGTAVMGDRTTLEAIRQLAKNRARRNAASKLGTVVQSESFLTSMTVDGEEVSVTREDISVLSVAQLSLKEGTAECQTEKAGPAIEITCSATYVVDMERFREGLEQVRENRAAKKRLFRQVERIQREEDALNRLAEEGEASSSQLQRRLGNLRNSYRQLSEALRPIEGEAIHAAIYEERLRRLEGMKMYLQELMVEAFPTAIIRPQIVGETEYVDEGEDGIEVKVASKIEVDDSQYQDVLALAECYRSALYPEEQRSSRDAYNRRYRGGSIWEADELTQKAFGDEYGSGVTFDFGLALAWLGKNDEVLALSRLDGLDVTVLGQRNIDHRSKAFRLRSYGLGRYHDGDRTEKWTVSLSEQQLAKVRGVKLIIAKGDSEWLRERGYRSKEGTDASVYLDNVELTKASFMSAFDSSIQRIEKLISETAQQGNLRPGGRAVPCDQIEERGVGTSGTGAEESQEGVGTRNGYRYNGGLLVSSAAYTIPNSASLQIPAGEVSSEPVSIPAADLSDESSRRMMYGGYLGVNLTQHARHRLDVRVLGGVGLGANQTYFQVGAGATGTIHVRHSLGIAFGADVGIVGVTSSRDLPAEAGTYTGVESVWVTGSYPSLDLSGGVQLGRFWRVRLTTGYHLPLANKVYWQVSGEGDGQDGGGQEAEIEESAGGTLSGGMFFRATVGL